MTDEVKPRYRWTPEHDVMLSKLVVEQGLSFSEAARELASMFRQAKAAFTRNSCISRAHRLGLKGAKKYEDRRRDRLPPPPRVQPSPPKLRIVPTFTPPPKRRFNYPPKLMEIVDGTCQFMGRDSFNKCGKPHDGKTNWCEYHRNICYVQRD